MIWLKNYLLLFSHGDFFKNNQCELMFKHILLVNLNPTKFSESDRHYILVVGRMDVWLQCRAEIKNIWQSNIALGMDKESNDGMMEWWDDGMMAVNGWNVWKRLNAKTLKYLNAKMLKCRNTLTLKCWNCWMAEMLWCLNAYPDKCLTQKYSNIEMLKWKIFERLKCWFAEILKC